jgi:beta-lactamase regulating signal transducer with metallopeptidase domain
MTLASSLIFLMLESAARSLLLAAAVAAGLAALRVRNVVAQKAAWTLVLAAAMLMPVLAPLAARVPWFAHFASVPIPQSWLAQPANPPQATPAGLNPAPASVQEPAAASPAVVHSLKPAVLLQSPSSTPAHRSLAPSMPPESAAAEPAQVPTAPARRLSSPALIALLIYLAVSAALLLRLALGAWAAERLWSSSEPVAPGTRWILRPGLACPATVRCSTQIVSPVTLGPGIVLPSSYREWDAEKLRIVLAHEASHVRQRDFYLQLAASLHAAIFWFSPLGWWLKRRLSDLSETISDRAAVSEAVSHVSYAQVLLQFAAAPRPIQFGVAMAHHRRLAPRIERLLNESSFRQAFSGGRIRIAAAVLLVPIALFAATAMVRVQAARQQTPPVQPPGTLSGTAASSDVQTVTPPQTPAAPTSPSLPPAPPAEGSTIIPPGAPDTPLAPPSPDDRTTLTIGPNGKMIIIPHIDPKAINRMALLSAQNSMKRAQLLAQLDAMKGKFKGFNSPMFRNGFHFGDDGNSYAYVTGSGETSTHYSGEWFSGASYKEEIDKARKIAHGDFLWFERDGKSYVIDDPSVLAQLKPMQDRMDDLGKQQEELGRQQEELGKQQEALGRLQEQASVPTPDVSQELAKLNEAIARLNAKKGGTITQEELAEIQEKLGDLQGKIGDIEGRIGEKQGELGEKQGKLGEQQGRLGEQQGKLGTEQGRIAREMDGKVLTIIDESLKNGKARPVE